MARSLMKFHKITIKPLLILSLSAVCLWLLWPQTIHADDPVSIDPNADWFSGDNDRSFGSAWGDVDNDGDLDYFSANQNGVNRLYLNEGGRLSDTAAWEDEDGDNSYAVAWGDVDNDGDLDIVVANAGDPTNSGAEVNTNKLYLNIGGTFKTRRGLG